MDEFESVNNVQELQEAEVVNEKTSLLKASKSVINVFTGMDVPDNEIMTLNFFEKWEKYKTLPIQPVLDVLLIISVMSMVLKKKFNKNFLGSFLYFSKKCVLPIYWKVNHRKLFA
jgi:hypothetical protein